MTKFYIFNLDRPNNRAIKVINAADIDAALPAAIALFEMHNDPSIAAVGEHRTFTWYEKFLLTPSPTIPASFLTN
jgi:hypothetical protein